MSVTDTKAIKASIAIQCMHVEALGRSIELEENDLPALRIGGDIGSATEAARYMRAKWQIPNGPIANLAELIEDVCA